jgi:hypothetical protein
MDQLQIHFLIFYFELIEMQRYPILHKKAPTFGRGPYSISWFWKRHDAAYMPPRMVILPTGKEPFFDAICRLLRCMLFFLQGKDE